MAETPSRRVRRKKKSRGGVLRVVAAVVAIVAADGAAAGTFGVPARHPVVDVDIPDDWRPAATADGVEGSVDDGEVRLSVQFIVNSDLEAAIATTLKALRRAGVGIAPGTRRSRKQQFDGLDGLRTDYSGEYRGGDADVTLISIAAPDKSGVVVVAYWGDGDAQESVGSDLLSIADSLRRSK
jgi:hypothetical protein